MDILNLLSSGTPVSGEHIARSLRISRAAVHKRILRLRKQGYTIIGHKNLGYSLLTRPDRLTREEIAAYLPPTNALQYDLNHYDTTESTQTLAKDMAIKGKEEGAVFIAEKQTFAYGRMRREWASPEGGIWFSVLLRPPILPDAAVPITFLMSLAICKSIEEYTRLVPAIKWPNDVLIGGKKVAGILTEMSAEVGKVNWVIAGAGINVNNALPGFLRDQAVSLSAATGQVIHRAPLFASLLNHFSAMYRAFCNEGFGPFATEYNQRSCIIGKPVLVNAGNQVLRGTAEQIDGEGYLWLTCEDGTSKRIIAGDVQFHPAN